MTGPAEAFLRSIEDRIEHSLGDGVEVSVATLGRLVRMGRRLGVLAEALRGDPGHDVSEIMVRPTEDRTEFLSAWRLMGATLLREVGPFEPGECRVCLCTRITACDVPTKSGSRACGWRPAVPDKTLCDATLCSGGIGEARALPAIEERDWVEGVVDRAREAADRGPAAMKAGRVRHDLGCHGDEFPGIVDLGRAGVRCVICENRAHPCETCQAAAETTIPIGPVWDESDEAEIARARTVPGPSRRYVRGSAPRRRPRARSRLARPAPVILRGARGRSVASAPRFDIGSVPHHGRKQGDEC